MVCKLQWPKPYKKAMAARLKWSPMLPETWGVALKRAFFILYIFL